MTDAEIADVLRPFAGQARISFTELGEMVGIDKDRRNYLVKTGLVRPAPGARGRHGALLLDEAEARRVAGAVVAASHAGTAISTALRFMRSSSDYTD